VVDVDDFEVGGDEPDYEIAGGPLVPRLVGHPRSACFQLLRGDSAGLEGLEDLSRGDESLAGWARVTGHVYR